MRTTHKVLALLLVLSLSSVFAFGQAISGDLTGTVVDPQGAVVSNATVVAENVATGAKSTVTTNSTGGFRIANLPIGTYNITASGAGFKESSVKGLIVELNKTVTLKLALSLTSAETIIDVTGTGTVIDTSTPQIQTTFETRQLQNASAGTGILNLSLLNAGVASSGGLGAGTGPSVSGQRPRNNNFTIEGVDNNSRSVTGPLVFIPNDAVQNFTVLQNQFSPEFGHSTGGQFNTVIVGGTNQFHGRIYDYLQNRNLNAIDVRNNSLTQNPRYDQNRLGGQIGGPILKNKLFFFGNFEYNPLGQASNPGSLVTPTAAGKTLIAGLAGLSATSKSIFAQYVPAAPVANQGTITVAGTPIPVGDLTLSSPNFQNGYYLTTSMDYVISSKDQLRGRYIYNKVTGIDVAANFPDFYQPIPNLNHVIALNEFHTFSPTLQNELRLGYNRFYNTTPSGNFTYPGLDSFPNITIDELSFNIGPDGNAPQFTVQNTYQLVDNVSWTKGAHQLKFGYEGRRVISPQTFTQRARGDYEYSTLDTWLKDLSPDVFAERSIGFPVYYGDEKDTYFFANDVWKFRPNLTLNIGLRYEYNTPTVGETTQALNQAASVPGLIDFSAPRGQKNKFMPRLGFAWSPGGNNNMVVRGGFAMAYDVLYDNIGILSLPPQLSGTIDPDISVVTNNFLANGGIKPATTAVQTFPTLAAQRAATSNYIPPDRKYPYSITYNLGIQRTFGKAYTAEVRYVGTRGVHLNVQTRLNIQSPLTATGKSLPTFMSAPSQATVDALTTTLSGLRAVGFFVPAYANAGFNQNGLVSFQPFGGSVYHGLQSQLTRQFTNGLQMQAAYTWSHTIDDSTADFFTTVLSPRRMQDFQNLKNDRGTSALDRRHRLTVAALWEPTWFNKGNWFTKNVIGNWQFAPIYTFESPQYATVRSGVDSNLNNDTAGDRTIFNAAGVTGTGSGVTPLCTSALPAGSPCGGTGTAATPTSPATVDSRPFLVGYLAKNPNAQYIVAGAGALATAGRNTLRTNPINNWDFTMGKKFNFTERTRLEFQAQFLNFFNHPQFVAGRVNDVSSATLVDVTGQSVTNVLRADNANFGKFNTVFSSVPRTVQLALKFVF